MLDLLELSRDRSVDNLDTLVEAVLVVVALFPASSFSLSSMALILSAILGAVISSCRRIDEEEIRVGETDALPLKRLPDEDKNRLPVPNDPSVYLRIS